MSWFRGMILSSSLLFVLAFCPAAGQETSKVDSTALKHWQDLRFGMFIHWGPVSQTGQEIGWSRGREIPVEEYYRLYLTFNPTHFSAEDWAIAARQAGARYVVLTSKHHDGFCLWETRQTDYSIMNSPLKRDVVKELALACKKQGLAFGLYYSTCDWHHPDFPIDDLHPLRNHPDRKKLNVSWAFFFALAKYRAKKSRNNPAF